MWLLNGQVEDSTAGDYFFYPFAGTELGSHPSLTARDRELVSVLEVRIEPGDLNPRPLTPQSVTLPTLPRAGFIIFIKKGWQCKAGKELLTPYQSEDPKPTTPTHKMKEEKGKTAGEKN